MAHCRLSLFVRTCGSTADHRQQTALKMPGYVLFAISHLPALVALEKFLENK
jgi:hypothetical protein